jgi:DNA polymerase-1
MGVNALRQNLGGTREEAQKFYNGYFKTFKSLAKYIEKIKAETDKKGYTETLFGRRRYFEGIRSKIPYIKAAAERMAVNAPFQGTAADIIKIAMRRIHEMIREKGFANRVFMILQVHDELLFEVEDTLVEEIAADIKRVMEGVLTAEKSLGVVCVAHGSVGNNWADMIPITDFKFQRSDSGRNSD